MSPLIKRNVNEMFECPVSAPLIKRIVDEIFKCSVSAPQIKKNKEKVFSLICQVAGGVWFIPEIIPEDYSL